MRALSSPASPTAIITGKTKNLKVRKEDENIFQIDINQDDAADTDAHGNNINADDNAYDGDDDVYDGE